MSKKNAIIWDLSALPYYLLKWCSKILLCFLVDVLLYLLCCRNVFIFLYEPPNPCFLCTFTCLNSKYSPRLFKYLKNTVNIYIPYLPGKQYCLLQRCSKTFQCFKRQRIVFTVCIRFLLLHLVQRLTSVF